MPPRASWKGSLKLSLVSLPVRMYNAVSSTARIHLNQLHAPDGHRIRYQLTCPEHGEVPRSEIVRGYEYEKGRYVVVDESDLERIRLETTRSIELTQFVAADEVDPLYYDAAYYVAPDGRLAEGAFRVIREAMRRAGRVGVGRVVVNGREVIVALAVRDRGFVLHSLHYADEVRSPAAYFEAIADAPVPEDELALASELVERITAPFDPSQFTDRYQAALLAVIRGKVKGEVAIVEQPADTAKVIDLMDALKRSVAGALPKKPPAESVRAPGRRAARKRSR